MRRHCRGCDPWQVQGFLNSGFSELTDNGRSLPGKVCVTMTMKDQDGAMNGKPAGGDPLGHLWPWMLMI